MKRFGLFCERHALWVFLLAVIGLWAALQFHDSPSAPTVPIAALDPDGDGFIAVPVSLLDPDNNGSAVVPGARAPADPVDTAILTLITVGFTAAVLCLLRETRNWGIRALGMFGTYTGDAILYAAFVSPRYGVEWSSAWSERFVDAARSFFGVGGVLFLLALGLMLYLDAQDKRLRGRAAPA